MVFILYELDSTTGLWESAEQVIQTTHRISAMFDSDAEKISSLKRAAIRARKVHDLLRKKAIVSVADVSKMLGMTAPTARAALGDLKKLGITDDISGKGKERLYIYTELVALLEQGAEPIPY